MVRVFIVDDEPDLLLIYKKILIFYGFEVVGVAKNGEEAVSMFKSFSQKPDIILMDHRMPIKNGIEAAKEILQIDKSTKIIFASADNSIKEKAFSIGALSFKDKPFTNKLLISNINKALNKT